MKNGPYWCNKLFRNYSGRDYSSKSVNSNIPYTAGSRIRLGDLARYLLENKSYGGLGNYIMKIKHKNIFEDEK